MDSYLLFESSILEMEEGFLAALVDLFLLHEQDIFGPLKQLITQHMKTASKNGKLATIQLVHALTALKSMLIKSKPISLTVPQHI